ncbi:MAG: hypothetical protein IT158_12380 [Bryobacterales bacterium]|nr:hypothetical protein [Bryobacterales bacterium]
MKKNLICRKCGSSDVMRTPRRGWERAFEWAVYFCRACGKRWRTTRPEDDSPPEHGFLLRPSRALNRAPLADAASPPDPAQPS